jgi:hypothetical protein
MLRILIVLLAFSSSAFAQGGINQYVPERPRQFNGGATLSQAPDGSLVSRHRQFERPISTGLVRPEPPEEALVDAEAWIRTPIPGEEVAQRRVGLLRLPPRGTVLRDQGPMPEEHVMQRDEFRYDATAREIQGSWSVRSMSINGKPAPAAPLGFFVGDSYMFRSDEAVEEVKRMIMWPREYGRARSYVWDRYAQFPEFSRYGLGDQFRFDEPTDTFPPFDKIEVKPSRKIMMMTPGQTPDGRAIVHTLRNVTHGNMDTAGGALRLGSRGMDMGAFLPGNVVNPAGFDSKEHALVLNMTRAGTRSGLEVPATGATAAPTALPSAPLPLAPDDRVVRQNIIPEMKAVALTPAVPPRGNPVALDHRASGSGPRKNIIREMSRVEMAGR